MGGGGVPLGGGSGGGGGGGRRSFPLVVGGNPRSTVTFHAKTVADRSGLRNERLLSLEDMGDRDNAVTER